MQSTQHSHYVTSLDNEGRAEVSSNTKGGSPCKEFYTVQRAHTLSLSLSHTHTHSLSLSHTHTQILSLSFTYTHTQPHTHTHTHIYTQTHTLSLTDIPTQSIFNLVIIVKYSLTDTN